MGNPKAAVFPLPVAAVASTSRPSIKGGMARFCIGVGCSNPRRSTAFRSLGSSPNVANDMRIYSFRGLGAKALALFSFSGFILCWNGGCAGWPPFGSEAYSRLSDLAARNQEKCTIPRNPLFGKGSQDMGY